MAEDLATRAGVEAFIANEQKWAAREFARKGRLVGPHAVIFATFDPRKGEPFDGVGVVPVFPAGFKGNPREKDLFGKFIEVTAIACRSIGVLFVMESWLMMVDRDEDPERFEQLRKRPKSLSLEHEPGRQEGIVISLEHLAFPSGAHYWISLITRNDAGVGSLGPFVYSMPQGVEGRFTHLFHREGFA